MFSWGKGTEVVGSIFQVGLSPRALPEPHCSPEGHGLGRNRPFRKLSQNGFFILFFFFFWLFGSFCRMPSSSCPSFSASKYCFSLSSSPNLFLNYCFVLVLLKTGRSLSQWYIFPDSFLFFQLLQMVAECLSAAWFPSCTGQNCEKTPVKSKYLNKVRCREKWEPSLE